MKQMMAEVAQQAVQQALQANFQQQQHQQELQQQQQVQIQALQDQLAQAQSQNQAKEQMEEDDGYWEWKEHEGKEKVPDWESVFPSKLQDVTQQAAKDLVARLAKPPSQELLNGQLQQVARWRGVPHTAVPRQDARDRRLHALSAKVEAAMNLLVQLRENGNIAAVDAAAGFLRSAFEDIHQERRALAAGGAANKLAPREDKAQGRLLTPEEEKEVRATRSKGKGKGKGWRTYSSSGRGFRSRSRTRSPGGKGKGKGKGKQE